MTVLTIIGFIVVLILIIPIFMRKVHHVQREIVIDVPVQKAFDFLRILKNHEKFNKWAGADPNRKEEFKGTDGTLGFIYAWSGNKNAGEGEKEIMKLIENKKIEIEMRFVKPFKVSADFKIDTEAIGNDHTKVTWSNTSALKYPLNIMVPMVERSLAKDMDESLMVLKNILEKE